MNKTGYLPIALTSRVGHYRSKSHNHELQLISPQGELLGGLLDFVAGAYYFSEDYRINERLQLEDQYCNALVPAARRPACNSLLASGAGTDATDLNFAQDLKSFAIYGQATLNISERLALILGGRWTREDKDGQFIQLVNNPFAVTRSPENVSLAHKDDRFTYRIGLNYKPSEDALLFASYSTGFKSGGFNSGGGTPALGPRRLFARETVKNYEVGAKTDWLDHALTVNATLYRMDIAGYQDRSFDGTSFIVRNAGNLRHQGVELDLVAKPDPNVRVNASVAYLDSRFTSYPGASALPGIPGVQDLTGGRAHFAPEWTGNVSAEWRGDIGSSGMQWALSGNVSFVSDQFLGGVTDNNPQTIQDGYALLGGRFSLEGPGERWTVSLFGTNLTNKAYAAAKFYQPLDAAFGLRNGVFTGSTAVRAQRAEPRTYGVAATIRF